MAVRFSELHDQRSSGRAPVVAAKCWQVLVSYATMGKPITYARLAQLVGMGQTANTITKNGVVYVMAYCQKNREAIPALNAIVCNRNEAAPGDQIPNRQSMFDVFDFDWCDVIPPTPEQLECAWRDLRMEA